MPNWQQSRFKLKQAMTESSRKDARLVARVSDDIHSLINSAAELTGSTMSQFLISAVVDKAQNVVQSHRRIELSMKEANDVFKALESKGKQSNKKLQEAARKYREAGLNGANH